MTPNQRRSSRLTLEATNVGIIDIESGVEFSAEGSNLSGEGLAFHSRLEPSMGADMHVVLRGSGPAFAPLHATFQVLRVKPAIGGGFDVAGRLTCAT